MINAQLIVLDDSFILLLLMVTVAGFKPFPVTFTVACRALPLLWMPMTSCPWKTFIVGFVNTSSARGITVADALETSCSRYADVDSIVCIRNEVALFVKYVDCNERHVLAICLERLDVCAEVTCKLDL